jgi:hypothetical protein
VLHEVIWKVQSNGSKKRGEDMTESSSRVTKIKINYSYEEYVVANTMPKVCMEERRPLQRSRR